MFYYAQIDENGICFAVSQLSGEIAADNMILLDDYDSLLLGKKYNNGTWEVIPEPEPQEPTPTDQEIFNAEIMKMLNEMQLNLNGGVTNG